MVLLYVMHVKKKQWYKMVHVHIMVYTGISGAFKNICTDSVATSTQMQQNKNVNPEMA